MSHLWLNGPYADWLHDLQDLPEEDGVDFVPEVCHQELKRKKMTHTFIVTLADRPCVGELMNCKDFSSFHKLHLY